MSGKRLLLDTNAIVQLLAGNNRLLELVSTASFIATSVICKLEFFSFSGLSASDMELYHRLESRIATFPLANDDELMSIIRSIRVAKTVKLPDAIIAATAIKNNCGLVSADHHFNGIDGLSVIDFL